MENLSKIIEGILFVAGEGVSFLDIAEKLEIDKSEVAEAVKDLQRQRQENNDGIQVIIYNEKAQLCSNKNFADTISVVLNPIKEKMLTKIVLEVCGEYITVFGKDLQLKSFFKMSLCISGELDRIQFAERGGKK